MKNIVSVLFFLVAMTLTGCEIIGDIFSAGFYTALILVVIVVAIVVYIIYKIRR